MFYSNMFDQKKIWEEDSRLSKKLVQITQKNDVNLSYLHTYICWILDDQCSKVENKDSFKLIWTIALCAHNSNSYTSEYWYSSRLKGMLLNRRLHPAIQSGCPSREPFIQLREGEAIMKVNRVEQEHNIMHTCSLQLGCLIWQSPAY